MTTKSDTALPQPPAFRFWGSQKPRVLAAATPRTVGTVATIRIYGPIDSWGGWWGVSAKEVAEALDNLDASVETVQVRLNSPGGDAFEGVAIMNLLRAHKAHIVTVVDGLAASAASIVATGSDELVMSPGSELMIHDASTFAYGDAGEMDKARRMLDSVSNTIASVYAAKSGGTLADWRALMVAETWYTADEAVASGLADRTDTVPDAGVTETAGGEPDVVIVPEGDVEDMFDLSRFTYAGRSHAPAPAAALAAAPKPPTASADGNTQPEGAAVVDLNDEQITALREQVGFPADADADTIVAAVKEALAERAEPPKETTTTPVVPAGMALVDSAVLQQIQSDAAAGRKAETTLAIQERDAAINKALRDGKIAATSKAKFVEAWDKDAESTQALLDALTPGLVPVAEMGHGDQPETTVDDELYAAVFGDEKIGA